MLHRGVLVRTPVGHRAIDEETTPRLTRFECGALGLFGLPGDVTGQDLCEELIAARACPRPIGAGPVEGARPSRHVADLGAPLGQILLDQAVEMEADRIGVQPHARSDLADAEVGTGGLQHVENAASAVAEVRVLRRIDPPRSRAGHLAINSRCARKNQTTPP